MNLLYQEDLDDSENKVGEFVFTEAFAIEDIDDNKSPLEGTASEILKIMNSIEADLQKLKTSGPTSGEFELSVGDDEDW